MPTSRLHLRSIIRQLFAESEDFSSGTGNGTGKRLNLATVRLLEKKSTEIQQAVYSRMVSKISDLARTINNYKYYNKSSEKTTENQIRLIQMKLLLKKYNDLMSEIINKQREIGVYHRIYNDDSHIRYGTNRSNERDLMLVYTTEKHIAVFNYFIKHEYLPELNAMEEKFKQIMQ
jgi:hemoglobin-like flavoprotein